MVEDSLLKVEGVSFKYNEFHLDKVTFSVKPGEIVGFLGKNGAGKPTTIKCLTGQVKPLLGSIKLGEYDLFTTPELYKSSIAYVCEETNIYDSLTPIQFCNIFSVFYPKWNQDKYNKLIADFQLDSKKKLSEFSKGMKMKFHLAFALSHEAKVLLLDEPTSGLDPFIRSEFLKLVSAEASKGTSVLFSTHIIEDAMRISDRIIFIQNGQIKFDISTNNINESCYYVDKDNLEKLKSIEYKILGTTDNGYMLWVNTSMSTLKPNTFNHCEHVDFQDMLIKIVQ